MSRARNIKPGFFKNDRLAECSPLARILFAALWCEADREGRMEDRPKRIKAECLPYDDCDADDLLSQLANGGFILRYEVGGNRFIQILNFAKHQNPHVKEAASIIPAPCEHSASTVQAPDKHDESLEVAGLIPSSLIPSSLKERSASPVGDTPPAAEAKPKREQTGSRLPDDWQPDDQLVTWAKSERPDLNIATQTASFRDYWHSQPGQKGRKSDWPATFRNWIRNARRDKSVVPFTQNGGSRAAGRML